MRRPQSLLSSVRLAAGLAAALLLATGCRSTDGEKLPRGAAGGKAIAEIHLLSSPMAISLDGISGPAGFAVRVYASSPESATTIPISDGTLEVRMYDGVLSSTTAAAAQPLRVWTLTADELRPLRRVSPVGISYFLTLLWSDSRPVQDRITIVACHRSDRGVTLCSALTTIVVRSR